MKKANWDQVITLELVKLSIKKQTQEVTLEELLKSGKAAFQRKAPESSEKDRASTIRRQVHRLRSKNVVELVESGTYRVSILEGIVAA